MSATVSVLWLTVNRSHLQGNALEDQLMMGSIVIESRRGIPMVFSSHCLNTTKKRALECNHDDMPFNGQ